MKYKAYFSFYFHRDEETYLANENNPVQMLQVEGGTNRMIGFAATDDISLVSEMKQAQEFKNIILYLSPTKNHQDRKAALDLMEIANLQTDFEASLTVERFNNSGKLLEGIELLDAIATLKYPPREAFKDTMMVSIELKTPSVLQGKIKDHQVDGFYEKL